MPWPRHRKIGVGIILVGVAPFLYTLCLGYSHNWKPLEVPIVLTPGEIQSPEFKTDLEGRYQARLAFEKLPDLSAEQCLMGFPLPMGKCAGIDQTLEFDWQVIADSGTVIGSGSYEPHSFGGTETTFADFQGKRGNLQRVVLKIRRNAGKLNTAHPRLVVEAGAENGEELPDLYNVTLLWAETVGVLGFLWVLVPICLRAIKAGR